MRISWGEDYAVIFMSMLADNFGKRLVPLSEVSQTYKISLPFLKQLAMNLKKQGLIKSKEGVTGGYALTRPPSNITLLSVISALNDPMRLTACCRFTGTTSPCPKEPFCKTKSTWQKLNQEIYNKLHSVRLSDL